jgi:hypothetical protein
VRIHKLQHGTEKGNEYHPYFQYSLFPPDGAYPVLVVADAFLTCRSGPRGIVLMSRHFQRRPDLDHALLRVVVEVPGSPPLALPPCDWYIDRNYETVAIGRCAYDPGELCAPGAAGRLPPPAPLPIRVTYNGSAEVTAVFELSAPPEPPPSDFAMVAVFNHFSAYFLPLWMAYWRALGVDTFYLFFNDAEAELSALQAAVAGFDSSVVIVKVRLPRRFGAPDAARNSQHLRPYPIPLFLLLPFPTVGNAALDSHRHEGQHVRAAHRHQLCGDSVAPPAQMDGILRHGRVPGASAPHQHTPLCGGLCRVG